LRRFTDERARDLSETIALYNEVRTTHLASVWSKDNIIDHVNSVVAENVSNIIDLPNAPILLQALDKCLTAVLQFETTLFKTAQIDWDVAALSIKEQVDLRRFLRAQQHFLANDERVGDRLIETLTKIATEIIASLPQIENQQASDLTVPLVSLIPAPNEIIDMVVGLISLSENIEAGLFNDLQNRFYDNVCAATGVRADENPPRKPLVTAAQSSLPPIELAETYLQGTPFLDFFLTPVSFTLPQAARFEHHWIVAGSGHGKTQTLQTLIGRDLEAVANGEASVVVLDSQGDLIKNVAGLKLFAEGQPLHGKLCLIDPTDLDYPVQLNLFSLGTERLDSYSKLDRERLLNSIIELYDFVLAALLGAEMTSKQSIIFRFVTRALLHIPNATVHTLLELMEPGGDQKYKEYISKLHGAASSFFANEFNSTQFAETKRQVLRRLYGVLENQTFERMFSHPKSKLDLFLEMNSGK